MKLTHAVFLGVLLLGSYNVAFSQVELWGVTTEGGIYDHGCLFKTDENGENQEIVYSFIGKTGSHPQNNQLCVADDGRLFGILQHEESDHSFIIFAYDPANQTFRIINQRDTNMDFFEPGGSLAVGSNGHLFGVTSRGGQWNSGVIFELIPETGELVNRFDFNESGGQNPISGLIASDGVKLFGLTHNGGKFDKGVLFEYDINEGTYQKLHEFNLDVDGGHPKGTLLKASNGRFYGMTNLGGLSNDGTLFEFDIATTRFRKLFDFDGNRMGGKPLGGLIEGPGEILYGMTYGGGIMNAGVLFGYDIKKDSSFVLVQFDDITGKYPMGDLVLTPERVLFGMTSDGGKYGDGTLFHYDLKTKEFDNIVDFQNSLTGRTPKGSLVIGKDRKLYGMTSEGGRSDRGVLFCYDPGQGLEKLLDFNWGEEGYAPVYLYANALGQLYGTTQKGGENDQGILFQYDIPNHNMIKLHDFKFDESYLFPYYLMQASDKRLYGIVVSDNKIKDGILYRYDISKRLYKEVKRFNVAKNDPESYNNIAMPRGGVVEIKDGILVGTTYLGGPDNYGSIYTYDIDLESYKIVKYWDGPWDPYIGGNKYGNLLSLTDCNYVYGVTVTGGMNNIGTIYCRNPFHSWEDGGMCSQFDRIVFHFEDSLNGYYPKCSLIEGIDGFIYGTTSMGGNYDQGVLFEINGASNYYYKKADFHCLNTGCYPEGSLLQSTNGKLYGTTTTGGIYDYGVFFEYDPETEKLVKKFDFNGFNGKLPMTSNLVIIDRNDLITGIHRLDKNENPEIRIYPNPSEGKYFLDFGRKYQEAELKFFNIQGQLLHSEIFSDQEEMELDIRNLNPGSYILFIQTERTESTHKLIVR